MPTPCATPSTLVCGAANRPMLAAVATAAAARCRSRFFAGPRPRGGGA
ncbi:MAG: hypothetical protein OXU61_07020 [Gammaproteobacteria bacterium]|nr:hypothetical protein [Gammaproteobacteria bacterium]